MTVLFYAKDIPVGPAFCRTVVLRAFAGCIGSPVLGHPKRLCYGCVFKKPLAQRSPSEAGIPAHRRRHCDPHEQARSRVWGHVLPGRWRAENRIPGRRLAEPCLCHAQPADAIERFPYHRKCERTIFAQQFLRCALPSAAAHPAS